MVRDEPLRVSEVREVVPSWRRWASVPIDGDVHNILGGLVPSHAGSDSLHLFGVQRGLAPFLIRHPKGGQNLCLALAAPPYSSGIAGKSLVSLAFGDTLPDRGGRPVAPGLYDDPHEPLRNVGQARLPRL